MTFLACRGLRTAGDRLPLFIHACPPQRPRTVFEQDVYTNCETRAHTGLIGMGPAE